MLHLGLPEGVEQLIHEFASGWRPTPSAVALQEALQNGRVSDLDATTRCFSCQKRFVRCPREWEICSDGAVLTEYLISAAHCDQCIMEGDDDVNEPYMCGGLSEKSTWETSWEFLMDEDYDETQRDKLREYVRERLTAS